ncbi:lactoylglutathione lyase [Paenibacillus anaericanus]|uniref:Glyoxalase/bleomycin resistance/extradiol dioxygenase family protein n=1 Tax=Paenibacillus anaericanus TaxID=170367 RepID=A0A433Y606_9BACL|nr:VOC family protein [Paenibacillus anaericanus]MDQ0088559.1 lactoylglutathione lyase [Paenibacillus anaericanus]RUT44473.1 glyoxalase/bleomycin resistance/extradiol dioxygenase family protein [Paenibacillus anaericanus]
MRIEHIALWSNDLEQMKSFYMKYFKGIANDKYTNKMKQFESYFLVFEDGARIELMKKPEILKHDNRLTLFGYAHIAFSVGSEEKVIELTETLRNDGYTIYSEPRTTGDGYFESSILDPEGNLIEITI